jgi:hypothetical protein
MKIIVENQEFGYDLGCRLLKLKNDVCPFNQLEDIWDDIQPLTFKEIAELPNLEQRRVAMVCLGIERLVKEINPKLLDSKTLKKTTTWVTDKGELITKKFNDTYELYEVDGSHFSKGLKNSWQKMQDSHFVKFKDTSTDREYMIWVDLQNVYRTNNGRWDYRPEKVNAIQAIAWTIQTDIEEGNIEKIVRQGDCIMIKPIKSKNKDREVVRHLTEQEYKTLLVAES